MKNLKAKYGLNASVNKPKVDNKNVDSWEVTIETHVSNRAHLRQRINAKINYKFGLIGKILPSVVVAKVFGSVTFKAL